MDLFGRKARAEVAITVAMREEALAQRNLALDAWEAERALVEVARLIVSQKDAQIATLQAQLVEKEEVVAPVTVSSAPLYLNEQEEDIQYAFDNELIDKATYEDMLKQLEFDNTEITFDYS